MSILITPTFDRSPFKIEWNTKRQLFCVNLGWNMVKKQKTTAKKKPSEKMFVLSGRPDGDLNLLRFAISLTWIWTHIFCTAVRSLAYWANGLVSLRKVKSNPMYTATLHVGSAHDKHTPINCFTSLHSDLYVVLADIIWSSKVSDIENFYEKES